MKKGKMGGKKEDIVSPLTPLLCHLYPFLIFSMTPTGERTEWLKKDPATWKLDEDFLATERVVRGLVGVNDPAEHMCGVAKEFLVRIFYIAFI